MPQNPKRRPQRRNNTTSSQQNTPLLQQPDLEKVSLSWLWQHVSAKTLFGIIAFFFVGGSVFGGWVVRRDFLAEKATIQWTLDASKERERKAQEEIDSLKRDLVATRAKHRILEKFGSDFWFYRSYDIRRDVGEIVTIGNCNNAPCYSILLDGLDKDTVYFKVGGAGFHIMSIGPQSPPGSPLVSVPIPLRVGCKQTVSGKDFAVFIVIESDSYTTLRTGIGIQNRTKTTPGLSVGPTECPL